MQALKSTFADMQLRYRVSKMVGEATNTSKVELHPKEIDPILALVSECPIHVVSAIRERLTASNPTVNYLALRLLEACVNAGSYSFHVLVAGDKELHRKLVKLAAERADNETGRRVRSAARHIILEFSRMFADEEVLRPLSQLGNVVEEQSGRKLVRSLLLEQRRIQWRMPQDSDYVEPSCPQRPTLCETCGATNRLEAVICFFCKKTLPPLPLASEKKKEEESLSDERQPAEAEEEARKQAEAEEEARKQAEAEEEARKHAEAEEEARKHAEAEEEARKQAEAEARKQAEAEEEARRQAEAEARKQAEAEEEARKQAEAEARKQAEAEEEARKQAEAEEEARKQAAAEAEEEARRQAEADVVGDEEDRSGE